MTNSHEKRLSRLAELKGYRLEKVGKGLHHGRFSIVNIAEGARMRSGVADDEYTFSLDGAEVWLKEK